jgi:cell fate (sporulation/competence/biofilm development) regulator YlbF (YheA/YmcA/DUF963 family)
MKNSDSFTTSIVDGLRKAAEELEEFRLQFALGKADASDKFEEIKKDCRSFVSNLKLKLDKMQEFSGHAAMAIKTALEELQLQLALGKADAMVHFEIQEKKILAAIAKIEKELGKAVSEIPFPPGIQAEINQEIAKTRIKLKILRLVFELKKIDVKSKLKDQIQESVAALNKLAEKIKSATSKQEEDSKWKHFNEELKEAYEHLKTAFTKI